MKPLPNSDIRILIKGSDLFSYEVAQFLQIHESTFYRLLRQELSDTQKEKILNAIEELTRSEKERR